MKWRYLIYLLSGCAVVGLGIGFWKTSYPEQKVGSSDSSGNRTFISAFDSTPCGIALTPHKGDEQIDREIQRLQGEARSNSAHSATMKRLGWAFITKARL